MLGHRNTKIPMTENTKTDSQKRIVTAPQPIFAALSQLPANRVISIQLNNEEEVEWNWTFLPDGQKFVSGYTIIKKPETTLSA